MPLSSGPALERDESLYLDLVRALAAFFVVLDHAPTLFDLPWVPRWGHQAVVIFFLLSGYVITHVADTREQGPSAFLVARFARLWSVLAPAVALTVVCDGVGRSFGLHPDVYESAPADLPLLRVGAILLFLSETWVSIQPLSNGVVWSLCAEFWYYMLFAAWTFLPETRLRPVLLTIVAALAGFKALLLLPIWLMGAALQRWRALRLLSIAATLSISLTGTVFIAATLAWRLYEWPLDAMRTAMGPWVFHELAQAKLFWLDWIFGLAVAGSLLGARVVAPVLSLRRFSRPIRWCAGISFAAYLFHMPLLYFWAAFLPRQDGWVAIVLTLGCIAAFGTPVERSKTWWQRRLTVAANVWPKPAI